MIEPEPSQDVNANQEPGSEEHRRVRQKRKRRPPRRGAKKRLDPGSLSRLFESIISLIAIILDPLEHLLARTVALIPGTYFKAVMFDCTLIVFVLLIGDRIHETHGQNLCYACVGALSLTAILLTVAHVRNPGADDRLRIGQNERYRAIQVRPFDYQSNLGPIHGENTRN